MLSSREKIKGNDSFNLPPLFQELVEIDPKGFGATGEIEQGFKLRVGAQKSSRLGMETFSRRIHQGHGCGKIEGGLRIRKDLFHLSQDDPHILEPVIGHVEAGQVQRGGTFFDENRLFHARGQKQSEKADAAVKVVEESFGSKGDQLEKALEKSGKDGQVVLKKSIEGVVNARA